jgi:hypothetical protein
MSRFTVSKPSRKTRRRGALTIELVMVLPVVLLVLLAIVEISLLLVAGQAVSAAAGVGAREATMPGATRATVEQAVAHSLQPWKFGPRIDEVRIDPPFVSLVAPGKPVTVTVSVDAAAAAPDLLKYIGISLSGHKLSTTYVARKE